MCKIILLSATGTLRRQYNNFQHLSTPPVYFYSKDHAIFVITVEMGNIFPFPQVNFTDVYITHYNVFILGLRLVVINAGELQ